MSIENGLYDDDCAHTIITFFRYLAPNFTEKMYAKLHSKSALKRFLEQCAKRNVQRVTELIAKGTDPNFHDEDNGETPLTLAVMQDHVELITVLVEGGG